MKKYIVEDMTAGRGVRVRYTFLEKNSKGESLIVELTHCTNAGGKHSLPYLWKKGGFIDRILETYITVDCYVTDKNGDCWNRYNPQIVKGMNKINFDYMLEDTEDNRNYLLSVIEKNFNVTYRAKRLPFLRSMP